MDSNHSETPPIVGKVFNGFIALVWIGGFILIATYVRMCVFPFMFPPEERKAEETKKADETLARIKLKAEIQRAPDFPCQSPLEFVHFSGLGWYVTCDGCSALPASKLYPKVFMNEVELYAVDGRISLSQFLRMTGECP